MTRRARIGMMIIVPPISKGQESDEEIVTALVRTFKPARPDEMANGVDAVDRVVNEYGAYEEAPRQQLRTRGL